MFYKKNCICKSNIYNDFVLFIRNLNKPKFIASGYKERQLSVQIQKEIILTHDT